MTAQVATGSTALQSLSQDIDAVLNTCHDMLMRRQGQVIGRAFRTSMRV